jgi:hypothetical protein
MDFQSDFANIQDLINYDGINSLEFTDSRHSVQHGGNCGQIGGNCGQIGGNCGQIGGGDTGTAYENDFNGDFMDIFNKAKQYKQRVNSALADNTNMMGGADEVKKKRVASPTILMTTATGKKIRADPYVKDLLVKKKLKNPDIFKITGLILKDAKKNIAKQTGAAIDTLKGSDPKVMSEYKKLESDYKKYVDLVLAGTSRVMSKGPKFHYYTMY